MFGQPPHFRRVTTGRLRPLRRAGSVVEFVVGLVLYAVVNSVFRIGRLGRRRRGPW